MKITASEVNKLRQATRAGMMDCKKALIESNGDFEKAIEVLRKKGQKVAANRADRSSSEGVVLAKVNENHTAGVIVSLNCETDFVAKNESYLKLATELTELALSYENKETFLAANFDGMTVAEKITEQTGVIGEKIEIGSFQRLNAPYVGFYIHAGNKIATLVGLSVAVDNAAEISKNIAMQVAAMNPIALDETGMDATIIKKELEITKEQLRREGKPEATLENTAKGKLNLFFKDNTLVNQNYIKDGKISVSDYVKSESANLKVTEFKRVAII